MNTENIQIPAAKPPFPRGSVTIEVSDATTGEIQQRQKKTNFVQQRFLESIAEFGAHLPVGQRTFYINGSNFFDSILLTDYAGAPQPETENFEQGNVIGFGIMAQGADGTRRGAWNAAESIIRSDYIKLVFDFATSQANGTFQSIYTRKQLTVSGETSLGFANAQLLLSDVYMPFAWNRVKKYGTTLYFWHSAQNADTIYKVADFTLKLQGNIYQIDYETIKLIGNVGSHAVIRGNEIYVIYAGANIVKRATLTNGSTFADVATLPIGVTGFAYHEATDRFFVEKNASNDYVVYVYTSGFELIEVLSVGKSDQGLHYISDDGKFLIKTAELYEIATGLKRKMTSVSTSSSTEARAYVEMGKLAIGQSSQYDDAILAAPTFFSRSLLEQPVSKTSQQNMKITYEFTIPTLRLFGPDPV